MSQTLVQYLLLVAVVYKAVLQLRGKKERNPACWCMDTDDPDKATGQEERKSIQGQKQSSSTRDVKCKGFQGKAEVNFLTHAATEKT